MKKRRSSQGFGKNVSQIIFTKNKTNTQIYVQNLLTHIVIIDLNMFCVRMKNWIDRQGNSRDIVTPNDRDMREKDSQFFKQDVKPREFCNNGGQGVIFSLSRRARHNNLLLCRLGNGGWTKKYVKTSGGATVCGITSLVCIRKCSESKG